MIKQIFAAALLISVVALLAFSVDTSEGKIVVRHDNVEKKPLEIELGKYLCFESKALITDLNNTAQAVMPNGDTYFFYDIANSFTWLMRQKNKDAACCPRAHPMLLRPRRQIGRASCRERV